MPKTKIVLEFLLPTTSISRVQDCLGEIVPVVEGHKGSTPFVTIQGPIPDDLTGAKNGKDEQEQRRNVVGRAAGGRERNEPDDEAGTGGSSTAADAFSDDEPKRGRGRPRKSDGDAASPGPSERKRKRDDDAGTSDAEGADGAEPKRTRKGAGEGTGKGEGRGGSTGGSRDDQRGNREASRVTDDDDGDWDDNDPADGDNGDWADTETEEGEEFHAKTPGDDWPDTLTPKKVDMTVLTNLLSDHYKATGGKDRGPTFDIIDKVAEVRQLKQVPEDKYRELAKALLKDTARYTYGIKKPK